MMMRVLYCTVHLHLLCNRLEEAFAFAWLEDELLLLLRNYFEARSYRSLLAHEDAVWSEYAASVLRQSSARDFSRTYLEVSTQQIDYLKNAQ